MALVPALEDPAAVPDTPFIHLTGLAEKWEMDPAIRQGARGRGQLVQWLNPESVGVVSQNLASTNGGGLVTWVIVFDVGSCAMFNKKVDKPEHVFSKESHFAEHPSADACCLHLGGDPRLRCGGWPANPASSILEQGGPPSKLKFYGSHPVQL